jgi:hypothetical protein
MFNPNLNIMETCKKGVGKLSRKLLTILVLSAMTTSGLAMAQATGPNNVYIEQIGNQNTITIEQVGAANQVGGTKNTTGTTLGATASTFGTTATLATRYTLTPDSPNSNNYGTIRGNQNVLGITQTGQSNSAQYNIMGNRNTYSSTVTGDSNQTSLTIGVPQNGSTAGTDTNDVSVTETIVGNNNLIMQTVTGNNVVSNTSLTGNSNQIKSNLSSDRGTVSNTALGNYNIFNLEQRDNAGANGHTLVLNTTGDFNSYVTQQQGSIDTNVNIATNGNNNTITVRTSNATIINPLTAVPR